MSLIVFNEMLGATIEKIDYDPKTREEIVLYSKDGRKFRFYHSQQCCERVLVEDIVGDLNDLLNSPILVAEKNSSESEPSKDSCGYQTWTFYRFATIMGTVTVRWLGESNGCYSESVDFEVI